MDVPLLSAAILSELTGELGRPALGLSAEAEALLSGYTWPGNVRELENVLTQAAWRARGLLLVVADFQDLLDPSATAEAASVLVGWTLEQVEREYLRATLAAHRGNIRQTAEALGISRRTVYLKLRNEFAGGARSRAGW